jgi:hypothetical protein
MVILVTIGAEVIRFWQFRLWGLFSSYEDKAAYFAIIGTIVAIFFFTNWLKYYLIYKSILRSNRNIH